MGLLDGRRAVVTGGGSGIGRSCCLKMTREGAAVAVLDVDGEAARRVAAECEDLASSSRGNSLALTADVADPGAVEQAFGDAAGALGGLDIVVNNAGIGSLRSLDRTGDAEWSRLLRVNLDGTFYGIRAAAPLLRAAGGGAIVNIASLSGLRPTRGEAAYSAAKAGVIALTSSAALEYGPEIRVNCISPGFVETPLTARALSDPAARERIESAIPLRRVGTGDDVANVVAFLCSDLASYVTGANVVVDGGSILPSAQSDRFLADLLERIDRRGTG